MEVWNEKMAVSELEKHIRGEIQELKKVYCTKRRKRQLKDAEDFLRLIHLPEYETAYNIKELKQRLANRRNGYKKTIEDMKGFLPGTQLSMFDEAPEFTTYDIRAIECAIEQLSEEVHWLHKCLGICHNKEYFK